MLVGQELLLTARLAELGKEPSFTADDWEFDRLVHELEQTGKGCRRHHPSTACVSAREECHTAAFLAAAQRAAIKGKVDVITQLASEALRCFAAGTATGAG